MRIRSTKPEFWRSKTIAALDWDVRLVLKGLESYVDDNGVGKDDIALIAADVFPRDLSGNPPETLSRLSEAISRLSSGGLITRYVFDGEDLLYIERWKELQRIDKPTRGRFPRPDGTMHYADPVIRENYGNPREECKNPPENYAPGTGEQGNRGTGEAEKTTTPAPRRDDVEAVCTTLRESMIANGCRPPTITERWREDTRLLLDRDALPLDAVLAVLAWSQADDFWKANIQSPRKLRAKFDTLQLQMQRAGGRAPLSATPAAVEDWLRECWNNHDTTSITARCGIEFQTPDIPDDVTDVKAFVLQARRDWIKTNHQEILDTILKREATQ